MSLVVKIALGIILAVFVLSQLVDARVEVKQVPPGVMLVATPNV